MGADPNPVTPRRTESGRAIKPGREISVASRGYPGLPVTLAEPTAGVAAGPYELAGREDDGVTAVITPAGTPRWRYRVPIDRLTARLDDLVVPDDLEGDDDDDDATEPAAATDLARERWSVEVEPDAFLIEGVISVPRCYEHAERDAYAIGALPQLVAACVAITEAGDDLQLVEAFEAAAAALKAARLRDV